ncbi:tetratricopeptide repeat protein [Caballeronia telluris]|uniref:Tetratricopeptide repeat protein n=1 Tax=Caballeronia telluris TaxID=326475 RepID=A0A158ET89_9BURK|nr:tetratricopeptide repeat protein [Caballeronia telluris]SAL10812.1 Tetratricopeptide repeat protein [Caballeronia telluris]
MPQNSTLPPTELAKWLDYLEIDPHNTHLLQHAAQAAFDAGQYALCRKILSRQEAPGALSSSLVNLHGLACMSEGDYTTALVHFSSLDAARTDPTLRYNIAYANAMLERYEEAFALLQDPAVQALPPAVTLGVRVLHHLGQLDEAIQLGQRHLEHAEFDRELPGALATVCFDASRLELARHFASLTPDAPDCQAVFALLALNEGEQDTASTLLESAIAARPSSGRVQLGMGLCLLARQEFGRAAEMLDSAAATLKSHAGSWAAAAWAHLFAADLAAARRCFERAAHIDRGFAEAPGGLAVVACREQRFDEARHLVTTALRLDSKCLAAAFASSLLASQAGDQARATEVMRQAMEGSLTAGGPSLGSLIALRMEGAKKHI